MAILKKNAEGWTEGGDLVELANFGSSVTQ
jgi:hypothetical protein